MTTALAPRPTAAPDAVPAKISPRPTLVVAMLGFFVVALDAQIVNVTLPAIRNSLNGSLTGLQWVVTGYTLMFSALLLLGGSASERLGARRAYGLGLGLFIAASAACGFAPSISVLVAARFLQGAGAALVTPTSLALIREAFSDAGQRTRAIALWALGGSVGAAAGPLVGGALAQIDWRLVFFVNVPVGMAALLFLHRVQVSVRRAVRFDLSGQVAAVVALAALTFAIIEGGATSYSSPRVVLAFGTALASGIAFFAVQRRSSNAMVPLELFKTRTALIALVAAATSMAAFYGTVFLQSLYFQQLRGAGALQTGLLFLPMTALVAVLNPVAARTALRFGRPATIVSGLLAMAGGLTCLSLLTISTSTVLVSLAMIPVGVGGSFTVPPVTAMLIDSVPAERAGIASGVINTSRQVGGSLGVAAFGAVLAGQPHPLHGMHLAELGAAVLLIAGAVITAKAGRSLATHV